MATPSGFRRGVTLVELLVTITILAILGSAVLFASFGANRAARIAATQAKVASLHSLVTEKYDEFQTRRVDFQVLDKKVDWAQTAAARLGAKRIVLRMEVPDRWSDVVFTSVASKLPTNQGDLSAYDRGIQKKVDLRTPTGARVSVEIAVPRTTLSQAYLRRYDSLNTKGSTQEAIARIEANQGAECLYMVVTMATSDGEALGLFRESDIGDVDGDGAPEFLDAFGRPIHFLSGAPGFSPQSDLQSEDTVNDHDPLDPYRIDGSAFRLVPLIYSAGPDGDPDLFTGKRNDDDDDPLLIKGDIYAPIKDGRRIGAAGIDPDGQNWVDNIHNHDQNVRQ